MKSYKNIEYKEGLTLEVHVPEDKNEFPVFVWFHGGGMENGTAWCEPIAKTLCEKGIGMVSVNYRMYPNAKYPDYIEDCAEAVAWTFRNFDEYGKCKGIYAGGSSAGGYISMLLQFDNKYLQKHGIDPLDLAGYVHDAGQPTAHFNMIKYDRGVDGRRVIIDESAPIYHIGLAENYSPMLLIISDNDMENRLEQIQLVRSTLKHFGHEDKVHYKEMHGTHCAYTYKVDDNGECVFSNLIAEFVEKVEA